MKVELFFERRNLRREERGKEREVAVVVKTRGWCRVSYIVGS